MPKEIYNEGRVVGESAYEIYVRQHLAQYPDTPPASEKDWLSATIASGSSMLLKVPATSSATEDWTDGYMEIQLPNSSTLCAANTIVASFFDGEAHFPSNSRWADRITSYGPLILNNSTDSPETGEASSTATIPQDGESAVPQSTLTKLASYMNIIDGVVIHPGYWKDANPQPPEKDFLPNLADEHPRIRLKYHGKVDAEPLVLLTGFTISSVIAGMVGTTGSVGTAHYANGDFLGPVDFPWSSKIVFSVPDSYIHFMLKSKYDRNLNEPTLDQPSSSGTNRRRVIKSTAVIDMNGSDPGKFYEDYDTYKGNYSPNTNNPRIEFTTNYVNHNLGASILTVYQRSKRYPPALYGTYATSESNTYLNPLDVVAPGTVKMFYNVAAGDIYAYEHEFPGTWGINRKPDGTLQILVGNALVDISSTTTQSWISLHTRKENGDDQSTFEAPDTTGGTTGYTSNNRPTAVEVTSTAMDGTSKKYMYFAVDNKRDGTGTSQLPIYRNPSAVTGNDPLKISYSNSRDDLTWASLLAAWQVNKGIDILGDSLKVNKYSLNKPVSAQEADSDHSWNWTGSDLYDSESGASYLQFGGSNVGGGLRLYGVTGLDPTTNSNPLPNPAAGFADIPLGSIAVGPGWHSIYKVVNSSSGKVWAPLYGSEFDCGHILAAGSGGAPYTTHTFEYGLVILGRCLTSPNYIDTVIGNDPQPGQMYTNLLVNYYMDNGNKQYYTNSPLLNIWYIDRFGTPNVILKGSDDFELRLNIEYLQDSGTPQPHTRSVKLTNNSTTMAMEWMLIGKLNPAL